MTAKKTPVILWFRQDLRLTDNQAYEAVCAADAPVLPLYILDDENSGHWKMGEASRWWLHESLHALDLSLGGALRFARGNAGTILPALAAQTGARAVFWNRCYEPWRIVRDKALVKTLAAAGVAAERTESACLFPPYTVAKEDGTPYKVFTPFYKKGCLGKGVEPPPPRSTPASPDFYQKATEGTLPLADLALSPSIPWNQEMATCWTPGENGAQKRLADFLTRGLKGYQTGRDFPAQEHTSRLSPHLHFGEISPRALWHAVSHAGIAQRCESDAQAFLRELGWREFSTSLLYHWPRLPERNWQEKFDHFPWRDDAEALKRWQKGQTGYPLVDAGMRELWRTGVMHNRVRMIVGSFLVKNLLLDWRHGAAWFWDTLVDADLANNSASWQWIAGCGADAAPYFRIFNPVTQGQKFDPDGIYVRRYVPELAALPDRYIHTPWKAPENILCAAHVRLGETYPVPIVDLRESRARALAALETIK